MDDLVFWTTTYLMVGVGFGLAACLDLALNEEATLFGATVVGVLLVILWPVSIVYSIYLFMEKPDGPH
jgi:hypothetical protein